MANIKIILEDDETIDEVKDDLVKAFRAQTNGDAHSQESFAQPLPQAVVQRMQRAHQLMLQKMYSEIQAIVGKELIP